MNKNERQTILVDEQFKSSAYSLEPREIDEALCLRQEAGKWCVYYSERELKTGKKIFPNESEACLYFLMEMRFDPTTKQGWHSGFSLK